MFLYCAFTKVTFLLKKFSLSVRAVESVCIVFLKCHLSASVKKMKRKDISVPTWRNLLI